MCACLWVHRVHAEMSMETTKGSQIPRTWVTDCCELPCWWWEITLVLLTAQLSPTPNILKQHIQYEGWNFVIQRITEKRRLLPEENKKKTLHINVKMAQSCASLDRESVIWKRYCCVNSLPINTDDAVGAAILWDPVQTFVPDQHFMMVTEKQNTFLLKQRLCIQRKTSF